MSILKDCAELEENDTSMSKISLDLLSSQAFSSVESTSGPSVHCSQETMELLSDQGDLLTSVSFIDSICSDGPAKAAYVNGSTSPHISDEVLLDISKNVPGFLPKSLHAQNSGTNVQFEGPDSLRKEGEITIRQTLTAEDVENRGIWGFDTESPESSLDNYDDSIDISWNPQREFMKFLWDDDKCLEIEEKLSPVSLPINHKKRVPSPLDHRKRKRKEKLVLKVDPSEDLYSDFGLVAHKDHPGEGSHTEPSSFKKIHSRKTSKSQSPTRKKSKVLNGAAESVKSLNPKAAKSPIAKKLGSVTDTLADSGSTKEPLMNFPCNSSLKSQDLQEVACKTDVPSVKPFICKECGQCYAEQSLLLHHVHTHNVKQQKSVKEQVLIKNEGKDGSLQCPQCSFGTSCPNTFVLHAKTHEKDKRCYSCNKCNFEDVNEVDLREHLLQKHGIRNADLTVWKSDTFQLNTLDKNAQNPTSILCSTKRRKNKNSLKNPNQAIFPTQKVHTACAQPVEKVAKCSVKVRETPSPTETCGLLNKKKGKRRGWVKKKGQSSLDQCASHQDQQNSAESQTGKRHSTDCLPMLSETGSSSSPSKGLKGTADCRGKNTTLKSASTFSEDLGDDKNSLESISNHAHLRVNKQTLKKFPLKRKTSVPYHSIQETEILMDFPKCKTNLKSPLKRNKAITRVSNDSCDSNLECDTFQDCQEDMNAGFRRRLNSPAASGASSSFSETVCNSPETFTFKKEIDEGELDVADGTEYCESEEYPTNEMGLKACPYCPAAFESGISLSNHIRGHRHRVRARASAAAKLSSRAKIRRIKTGLQIKTDVETSPTADGTESDCQTTQYICPLCREWFETRTGLSNHVRGHLKRLGQPVPFFSKSPVMVLKELMQDKKGFQEKLQLLQKKGRRSRSLHPVWLDNGLTFTPAVKRNTHAYSPSREEKKRIETNKGSPPSDLIGILKKRRAHEETKAKYLSPSARKSVLTSPGKDCGTETLIPCKAHLLEKDEHIRKVCVHCNASFHSGVSLSNHLRGYAQRKKRALVNGTAFDCKQRKQRSRSGSKKKTFPLLHTSEEIYRLTCRFCDLVFQGPLSVQEDWVKHLQRHIMNTAVPHTGAGMVEVTFPQEACSDGTVPETKPVMQISSRAQDT